MLDISGIDKIKLFIKLYNHIQQNTYFGKNAPLNDEQAAKDLLFKNSYDYTRFDLYCDLDQDAVDTSRFNSFYGNGNDKVFEEIVASLRKELGVPEKSKPASSYKPSDSSDRRKGDLDDVPFGAHSLGSPLGAHSLGSPLGAHSLGSPLGADAFGSSHLGVPYLGTPPFGAPRTFGASAAFGLGALAQQNWDRCGILTKKGEKTGEKIYFKQQANSGSNFQNPTAGSCGFISLGTTRAEVLKILSETKNLAAYQLITEHMELELLNTTLNRFAQSQATSFLASAYTPSGTLKSLQKELSSAQEAVVNIMARLKVKYWERTQGFRKEEILEASKWYINAKEFLDVMEKLYTEYNLGLDDIFEVATDISSLTDAMKRSKRNLEAMNEKLHDPKLRDEYLQQCIPAEWMSTNIALAWAISTKRTLRIWKHKEVRSKSEDLYLFRDTTDIIHQTDPKFKDLAPIDMIHTPIMMGELENHYERLIKVDNPIHGLKPSERPLVLSGGYDVSMRLGGWSSSALPRLPDISEGMNLDSYSHLGSP